jgi:hypothetical protein
MRHAWKKPSSDVRCTSNVDTTGDAPFGVNCGKPAVEWCSERHGGVMYQVCGAARCKRHQPRSTRGRS